MKLKRLYIENFGGLSSYSLEFGEGLTVICEPNGFGKTTLAEFIRAMFYGFPRKAKSLEKSRRQKYLPWNGGKCGGNLVFEMEGAEYRIERTFGATPRLDTFGVIDLRTGTKTDRFSSEIGTELFGLDADSFARSTYLPQQREEGPLTTDSIRAKLSDLVEDANDIGNFEKAMAALRSRRSAFIPYRGSGGGVAEAMAQITGTQDSLARIQAQQSEFDACMGRIAALETQTVQSEQTLGAVRARITAASEAAAEEAMRAQYERLVRQRDDAVEQLGALGKKYPAGLPDYKEIDTVRQTAQQLAALSAQKLMQQADLDAVRTVEENRTRFDTHIPTSAELDEKRAEADACQTLTDRIEKSGLSAAETERLNALSRLYDAGALEDDRLERLAADSRELVNLRRAQQELVLSAQEQTQLDDLQRYFAPGVPEAQALLENRQKLARAQQLWQDETQQAPKKRSPALIPAILGVLALAAGVALLAARLTVFGVLAAVCGLLMLVGAGYLSLRQMLSRELGAAHANNAAQAEADALEREVRDFAAAYTSAQPAGDALAEIESRRGIYLTLARRQSDLRLRSSELAQKVQALDEALCTALGQQEYDAAILQLHLARTQYGELLAKKETADAETASLTAERAALSEKLGAYLGTYFGEVQPENFRSLTAQLERLSDAYVRACAAVDAHAARVAENEKQTALCRAEISAFFARWELTVSENLPARLQQLRDDRKCFDDLTQLRQRLNEEITLFSAQHSGVLGAPVRETADIAALKADETRLMTDLTEQTRQLLQQRQTASQLRVQIDRIPALRDEIAYWQAEKLARQEKADLLDRTMDYLEKAKENLSASYLGPISCSFAGYLSQLAGVDGETALITPELGVQLERQGQTRELAYFSAGQTDLVGVGMRLALVDALFGDETMFVILDDPFVNLDDSHTAAALELLGKLAEQRQILYLVCNTSRSL